MEAAKTAKHGDAAKAHGHDFSPFVLETYGFCGTGATRFLETVAVSSGIPGALRDLRERVAVAVQRGNSLLARQGLDLVKRALVGAPSDHAPCLGSVGAWRRKPRFTWSGR
jgi:hypothetical protein